MYKAWQLVLLFAIIGIGAWPPVLSCCIGGYLQSLVCKCMVLRQFFHWLHFDGIQLDQCDLAGTKNVLKPGKRVYDVEVV